MDLAWLQTDGARMATISAAACTVIYLACRTVVLPHRSAGFSNRVVSLLHAIVAMVLCVQAIDWSKPLDHFGKPTRPAEMLALSISTGYFFYDTICCLLIEADVADFLHHVCTLAGLAVGVFLQRSGVELTLCLLLMEVSNPFLHARYLMRELGLKETPMAEYNQIAFVLTFFVCRVILGPVVVYGTLTCPTSHPAVKVGGLGIQVVSLFWFYKIVQVAIAKFGGKAKKSK